MDTRNLAIVFGVFGNDEDPKGGDLLSLQGHKVSLPKSSWTLDFDIACIGYIHGRFDHSLPYDIR